MSALTPARLCLGRTDHYLGRAHKGLVFDLTFDPRDRSFLFHTPDHTVTLKRPALALDANDTMDIQANQRKTLRNAGKQIPLRAHDK